MNRRNKKKMGWVLAVIVCLAVTISCAGFGKQPDAEPVPEVRPGVLAGYLQPVTLPDSYALLPPPPAKDSAAFALDEEVSRQNLALRGTPRWNLAIADVELRFPEAASTFSCALGIPVTEENTPHLYMLLRRSLTDAGLSTYAAKAEYGRKRPFMVNKASTCSPEQEGHLRNNGSYPSGHTAIGWAWALILSEIAPDRANMILARGRAFGESRVVCNVHWNSDVVAGRFMGAAAVARLHGDPVFLADVEAAKAEFAALRAKGAGPARDCGLEREALANDRME